MERLGTINLAHQRMNFDVWIYLIRHRLQNNFSKFAFPHAVLPSELLWVCSGDGKREASELVIWPAVCGHLVAFHDLKCAERPWKLILLKTDNNIQSKRDGKSFENWSLRFYCWRTGTIARGKEKIQSLASTRQFNGVWCVLKATKRCVGTWDVRSTFHYRFVSWPKANQS